MQHMRWGPLPILALFLSTGLARSLSNALRGGARRRGLGGSGADCYSPYDGRPLVQFSRCTPAIASGVQDMFLDGSCVCLLAEDPCCLHAPAICTPELVSRLSMAVDNGMTLIQEDAGGFYRNISGTVQPFSGAVPGKGPITERSFFSHWRGLVDQHARIAEVVGRTKTARLAVAGKSHEDRTIWAVRFTGERFVPGSGLKILMTFGVHAREWISPMAGTYVVERIANRLKSNPDWLAEDEIIVVPMVNPDGFVHSEKSDRLWRKNMRDNGKSARCNGVDLNRNFPVDWGGGRSTSDNYCSEVYIGPEAASEPETQAVKRIVDEGYVNLQIDYHSYSQLILAPWSYTTAPHKDRAELDRLTAAMAEAIQVKSAKAFKAGGSEILYPASGVGPDYTTERGGWGVTVELPPTMDMAGGGFMLPEEEIRGSVKLTFASFLAAYGWMKSERPAWEES